MLLIKNASIINLNPVEVLEGMDILSDKNKIISVGRNLKPKSKEYSTIDAYGRFITSGLVCSHNHFYSALARGILARINPSPDFISILKNLWWKLDRALDESSLYYSSLVGAIEAVKCGTTAVIDHNASPSFIAGSLSLIKENFERVGLRGILAYEITDRNSEREMQVALNESVGFISEVNCDKEKDPESYLVESAIGGHAPFTLRNATLGGISEAASATGRGIHFHVGEDHFDSAFSHYHYGKDILTRLEEFDLLNEKSILAHGVHLTDRDIDILNAHDSFLVHNPRSNMNNSVGYMNRLHEVKNTALGTDGIGSNMLEELKFTFFKNADMKGNLGYSDTLKLLFNGNEILSRYFDTRFGKIAEGYAADMVLFDYDTPTPLQKENIAGHFIFGLASQHVDTVIINSKVVYENKTFPFDTDEIYRESRQQAKALWERMDDL